MAAGEELSRLEELLRRPDFVLEPSVKESVRQYIKAGGKPEVILESLSEGYIGYPHMAMLMVKWMEYVDGGDDPPGGHDEFHYLKEFVKSKFDPDKFISVFGSQPGGARGSQGLAWLDGLLADPRGRKLVYELSALHRNSLLLNFAIQKIMKMGYQDEVAAAGSGLASYFSVFHRLLANKVSALLAAARRAAEAEAEQHPQQHQQDAAGGGASTSAAAAASGDGGSGGPAAAARAQALREVAGVVKELRDCCEHSQHTYLHVQHVLHHLGRQPGGEVLLAAAQQLEAEVAAAAPAVSVWSMQKLYAPPGCPAALMDACHLIGRVLQGGPDGPIGPDLLRLHAVYSAAAAAAGRGAQTGRGPYSDGGDGNRGGGGGGGGGGATDPAGLSAAPLQHPRLVQSLLASIFTPSRPPSQELLTACADLLARATCSRPQPPPTAAAEAASGQPRSGGGGGRGCSPEGGPQPCHQDQDQGREGAGQGGGEAGAEAEAGRERVAERMAETAQALHWAVGLLSRPHGRFTEEDTSAAAQVSRLPVVSHGLLHAVSSQLGSPAFYEDATAVAAALPSLLRLSLLVAEAHPQLTSKILAAWSSALAELPRAGLSELCRLVLDSCLALMMRAAAAAAAAAAANDGAVAAPDGGASAAGGGGAGAGGPSSPGRDVVREVLEMVEAWGRQGGVDPALVRYFVLQALSLLAPPYSPGFAGPLLRLLLAAGVRATTVRSQAVAALLRQFAAAAEKLLPHLTPPATSREYFLVADLQTAGTAGAGR